MFAMAPAAVSGLNAQQVSPGAANAKAPERVFIANGGGDFGLNPTEGAVAQRAYNEFFAGMKNWGRYEIVANPARADWVFEVSVNNRQTCVEVHHDDWVAEDHYSIRLAMSNVKDKGAEKIFVEHFQPGGMFSNLDKIFDGAVAALVDDVKAELGEPAGNTSLAHPDMRMAPVPPKISAATKIFIDNRGTSDARQEKYSGGGAQVYDQFSAALKSWGYEIVPSANEADLILEISFSVGGCGYYGDPRFTLVIQDAKTQVRLWGLTRQVDSALLTSSARKNFARGMIDLAAQIRDLAETPTWATDASIGAAVPAPASIPAIVGTQASTAAPIPVAISAANHTVKSGSDVRISVTVKNASKQNYDFIYPAGDPLRCMVAVRDDQGNMAADTEDGRRMKETHATWQGRRLAYNLQPGEIQTRECVVSELYDMTRPGKYSIAVQQLDGKPVQSNTEVVTVVP
jgi:hypothetical protein